MPRIYFTGRRKLPREHISIVFRRGQPSEFEAKIDLSRHLRALPKNARVVVEAYHNTMLQRFDFGTVADCRPREPLLLTSFDQWDRPRFRVRVIGVEQDAGVLLASCESIDAVDPELGDDGGRSMLKLYPKPNSEMQGELWKVTQVGADYQLWYNKDVQAIAAGIKGKHPLILGCILPAAIREILAREHLWEEVNTEPSEWTAFAQRISGEAPPTARDGDRPEAADVEGWISRVVAAFCRDRAKFAERIGQLDEGLNERSSAQ